MGVTKPDWLHWTKAQGFAATFCHDLNGKAAVEISGRFARFELGFLCLQQRIYKGLVLVFGHRTVEIGCAFFLSLTLIIARLHPGAAHVDAVGIDDRCNCIEKGQSLGAGLCLYGLGQCA